MKAELRHIDRCIRGQVDPEPFSGVVHITRGHDVMFERAYGLAIRSESIPNRVNTRFQIASGSKAFTSGATCRLVDRELLSFDALPRDCAGPRAKGAGCLSPASVVRSGAPEA